MSSSTIAASSSATQVVVEKREEVRTLSLRLSCDLSDLAQNSSLFSEKEIAEIAHAEEKIQQQEDPQDIATVLCYVLYAFVYPKIEQDPEVALNIEDVIKARLEKLYPDKNIEVFLEEKMQRLVQITQLTALQKKIDEMLSPVFSNIGNMHTELLHSYDDIKTKIHQIVLSLDAQADELDEKTSPLIEKIRHLENLAQTAISDAQRVGEDMQKENAELRRIAERGVK